MQVLVSDTSVLVDLERGNLLELAFRLSCAFAVPDLLYHRELRDQNGPALIAMGLQVEELGSEGVELAQTYRRRKPALSLPDTFALALAKTRQFTLLTGDRALRDLAGDERVECHGVLWVLDLMNDEAAVSLKRLYIGLQGIAAHPRCRLPRHEINVRLERFRGEQGGA
jgi:hypothetical protein